MKMKLIKSDTRVFSAGYILSTKLLVMLALAAILSGPVLLGGCSVLRGPESKTRILDKTLKKFKDALFWNSFDEIGVNAAPEDRHKVVADIKKIRSGERVVKIDVIKVELTEDEKLADVDMQVNYYKIPSYVVASRVERYTWSYDGLRDTWFLKTVEVLPSDDNPIDVQSVLGVH